jgi:hypothetical protein
MDEIIKLLMNMGKTKEEALEFIGKEMPTGGIDDVGSNIIRPITKKVAGDYPLIGSRITDPTQQGQYGKYFIQTLDPKDRYNLIRQSIDDQKENWQKTFEFIRTGGYKLSDLQKQNLNYNLGVLQRSKIVLTDITKGLESQKIDVEDLYSSFVKNKRFLGNERSGLSAEATGILEQIEKTKKAADDLLNTTKNQDEILKKQKKDNDARMKRLYEGRAYEKGDSFYRSLGGYHLPKLHEAGIINLDPKIYEAIKKGEYHHGGADFFAPDPNRVLRYHFGTKIFDDLDDVIDKAAMNGEVALKGEDGMIKFLKENDYLPFKKDGPSNALDYMLPGEKLERVRELDESVKFIKTGKSPFFETPDAIMRRVMESANDKFQYLDSLKRTHPGKFKLYEKDISEEPFFGVDIGQNDLFSDLSDLSFPKDKGDLLQFPKKEKVETPAKAGEGRFTKAQVLIERLKNTIKENPNDKYVQETFPGFIKEIEAKPELADNSNVQEAFGLTDLSETTNQRLVEYPDGTLDFYTKGTDLKSGMESVQSLIDELGISQEEAMRIKQLEPEDQILELTKLRTLKKRKDTPDDDPDFDMAEGGIIGLR